MPDVTPSENDDAASKSAGADQDRPAPQAPGPDPFVSPQSSASRASLPVSPGPAPAEAVAPAKVDPSWLALLVSAAALGLSLYQARDVATTRRNEADNQAIRTSYEIFRDLTRAQFEHANLSHLFETTNRSYRQSVRAVRASLVSSTHAEVVRLRLEERGMADHIFTAYEEIYFNWKQSVGTNGSAGLLEDDLKGYLPALLCNPRLQWYWSESGGRLSYNYAEELQKHYDENVKTKCNDEDSPADSKGPFADLQP